MPPKKQCSCKQHNLYSADNLQSSLFKIKGKQLKRPIIDTLLNSGDIQPHSTYLCASCAQYAEHHFPPTKRKIDIVNYLDEFIEAIREHRLNNEQLIQLAGVIGATQKDAITKDVATCKLQYRDAAFLKTFQATDWLNQRNPVVLAFVRGAAGGGSGGDSQMMKCIELIYAINTNFVAPLSFAQSLVTYFCTGSKAATCVQSAASPSGSYSTLQSWVKDHGQKPLVCPNEADVVTFFDNNQIIQRKWRVESHFKSTASVITNLVHITPNATSTIQCDQTLSPENWLRFDTQSKSVLQTSNDTANKVFEKYRDEFIKSKIARVFNQQQVDSSGNIHDVVDNGNDIPQQHNDRYSFVSSGHTGESVSVVTGNPCFENPCSYEAVQKVFDHIIHECGVGATRKWTMLGCDGLPYTLGNRLIESTYICPTCQMEFMDDADFNEHRIDNDHSTQAESHTCRKYKNIMLIAGLGHYEINMVKGLFKLLWEVCLIDAAKMLGFTSVKALAACQSASDHHKSWQILQIFMHAMSEELLVPYCRQCVVAKVTPSLTGYKQWSAQNSNPNYVFMCDVVFTYCVALHVFRAGVRRNNSEAINASKIIFTPLFFGLNMPFYMEISVRDSLVRLQCPPKVHAFIAAHESYTVSGNDTKGEGGDFVLESKNREVKGLVPAGVPDNNTWQTICRNVDTLTAIKKNVHENLAIGHTDAEYAYNIDLSKEMFDFRQIIRQKADFSADSGQPPHVGLSGSLLDTELVNFHSLCQSNQREFIKHVVENSMGKRKRLPPIHILKEDRAKTTEKVQRAMEKIKTK